MNHCPRKLPGRVATDVVVFVVLASVAALAWPAHANTHERWRGRDIERSGRMAAIFPPEDALPNPRLTPGAINPAVTQATLGQTICRRGGYTRSIRPPEDYTMEIGRSVLSGFFRRWRDAGINPLLPLSLVTTR
jgi:hypothetical protein